MSRYSPAGRLEFVMGPTPSTGRRTGGQREPLRADVGHATSKQVVYAALLEISSSPQRRPWQRCWTGSAAMDERGNPLVVDWATRSCCLWATRAPCVPMRNIPWTRPGVGISGASMSALLIFGNRSGGRIYQVSRTFRTRTDQGSLGQLRRLAFSTVFEGASCGVSVKRFRAPALRAPWLYEAFRKSKDRRRSWCC